MKISETSYGTLAHESNEVLNDSKVDDPPAFRMGAPATQRSLGKFSGDILDGSHREEAVLMQFKQTENAQNQVSGRGGEFYLGLKKEDAGSNDDAMIDVLSATVKGGFQFKLPVFAPNLGGGGGSQTGRFYSGNGKWCMNMQDDGHQVQYDTHNSQDESAWTPVWSNWSGLIKPLPW